MCFKIAVLTLICVGGLAAQKVQEKRQVIPVLTKADHVPAETAFAPAAAHHAGSKFFQYIHQPAKDHYEHGHKRGNDHHFIERHEKGHPHEGEFKTKVRWGDKHGGYGEHYWDFNHAGHGHDGDGEESQHQDEYAAYEDESQSLPIVVATETPRAKRGQELLKDVGFISDRARSLILNDNTQKHGGNYRRANDFRGKRQNSDVEFISPKARSLILNGKGQKHGGNYRKADDFRGKREQKDFGKHLSFDSRLGIVIDEGTGKKYELNPIV